MCLALNVSADTFTAKQIENAKKIKALKGGKNKKEIISLLNENAGTVTQNTGVGGNISLPAGVVMIKQ